MSLVANYNVMPRLATNVGFTVIPPTVDLTQPVSLKNIRGQVLITVIQSDGPAGVFSSFGVTGGFGAWPDDTTQNWGFDAFSMYNCTVYGPMLNVIQMTMVNPSTPLRVFEFVFSPNQMVPPTIRLIGGPPIGAATITVRQTKQSPIEGFY